MADIDVVKKGSSWWMWILAVIVAVVLVLVLWSVMGSDEQATAPRGDPSHREAPVTMAQNATDRVAAI